MGWLIPLIDLGIKAFERSMLGRFLFGLFGISFLFFYMGALLIGRY